MHTTVQSKYRLQCALTCPSQCQWPSHYVRGSAIGLTHVYTCVAISIGCTVHQSAQGSISTGSSLSMKYDYAARSDAAHRTWHTHRTRCAAARRMAGDGVQAGVQARSCSLQTYLSTVYLLVTELTDYCQTYSATVHYVFMSYTDYSVYSTYLFLQNTSTYSTVHLQRVPPSPTDGRWYRDRHEVETTHNTARAVE